MVFFREKLFAFAGYYSDYEPLTGRSFASQASEKLGLPADKWKKSDSRDTAEVLTCNGFKIKVAIAYRDSASITFTDTNAEAEILRLEKEIIERRKREERDRTIREKKDRETFKP